mmetsp:Transcript_718/g.1632  ORF Transcript_718/g.1632 Transcript_718/m.1632 type:complete len:85 (-) Transcript_718:1014-1268(-)
MESRQNSTQDKYFLSAGSLGLEVDRTHSRLVEINSILKSWKDRYDYMICPSGVTLFTGMNSVYRPVSSVIMSGFIHKLNFLFLS